MIIIGIIVTNAIKTSKAIINKSPACPASDFFAAKYPSSDILNEFKITTRF